MVVEIKVGHFDDSFAIHLVSGVKEVIGLVSMVFAPTSVTAAVALMTQSLTRVSFVPICGIFMDSDSFFLHVKTLIAQVVV